ncbi:RluA family pseudouridine synthase [Candidatus Protochlamydia phocaeensis]|uniref:RluA family pseudouridine synthase n=1 Tax=Candidatus Protochlamydia phocaeensis TaxID=1414722 RepID=UPI000838CDFD|nr:RluA family pseudouridine synthase [Candidatus Protochlamydia phocaeensis]
MQAPFPIIFEDNHLLVVNKPAGLLTQPSGTEQESVEQQAKAWLKVVRNKPGQVFLEAVHRLDKPVSGVVVFGKTSKALSRLNASIRAKQTKKLYYALVEGGPSASEGKLEHHLLHDDFFAQIVPAAHPQAKRASLFYRVIEQRGGLTLLEIELETGRYHQIRAQLAAIGCPIVGDDRYGSRLPFEKNGIALHHGCLQIPHPITQALCTFEAPLPASFQKKMNSTS